MATTMGPEAAAFLHACESIHDLISQQTLHPDDRALIEISATDLLDILKALT